MILAVIDLPAFIVLLFCLCMFLVLGGFIDINKYNKLNDLLPQKSNIIFPFETIPA